VLACCRELGPATRGECGGADALEEVKSIVQRFAGFLASPCPPQPLAVQQLSPCCLGCDRGFGQHVESRSEQAVRLVAGCDQCLGARQHPARPRCRRCSRSFGQPVERLFGDDHLAASGGGLDDVGQRECAKHDAVVVQDVSSRA
jgi:hypothetical protein